MDYLKLLYGCLTLLFAQIMVWFQVYGPLNIEFLKNNKKWLPYLIAIPISYLFIKGVELTTDAFKGQMWPSRFLTFSLGALSFPLLTYYFISEGINMKTLVCIFLSVLILIIQIFWK
jgi:hypothetical protein